MNTYHRFFSISALATALFLTKFACAVAPSEETKVGSSTMNSQDESASSKDSGTDSNHETDGTSGDPGTGETTANSNSETGDSGSSETTDFENEGECGYVASGIFKDNFYNGYIEYLLLADKGEGEVLCQVRFEVKTVAPSMHECTTMPTGNHRYACFWATFVALSNPEILININDSCANSDRKLGTSGIKELMNKPFDLAMGDLATGHGFTLLYFDEIENRWGAKTWADWDDTTGEVVYDEIEGPCFY